MEVDVSRVDNSGMDVNGVDIIGGVLRGILRQKKGVE